jgi:hypothetical protein
MVVQKILMRLLDGVESFLRSRNILVSKKKHSINNDLQCPLRSDRECLYDHGDKCWHFEVISQGYPEKCPEEKYLLRFRREGDI